MGEDLTEGATTMTAPASGRFEPGDHVCAPVAGSAGRLTMLGDFADAGLRRRHKVLFFTEDPAPPVLQAALRRRVTGAGEALDSGQLSVLSSRDVYLPGGVFRADTMLETCAAEIEGARREGYAGLRAAGDLSSSAARMVDPEALVDYETRLNPLFIDGYALALCQYAPASFPRSVWASLEAAHPVTMAPDGTVRTRLTCRRTAGGVRLGGEADLSNHAALTALLAPLGTLPECVVDAAGLEFADARAMAALLGFAVARGERRTVIVARPTLARVLHLLAAGSVPGLTIAEGGAG
jgi:MEDS: MEthanogen/methylotroph, DcmR Sensory domain